MLPCWQLEGGQPPAVKCAVHAGGHAAQHDSVPAGMHFFMSWPEKLNHYNVRIRKFMGKLCFLHLQPAPQLCLAHGRAVRAVRPHNSRRPPTSLRSWMRPHNMRHSAQPWRWVAATWEELTLGCEPHPSG